MKDTNLTIENITKTEILFGSDMVDAQQDRFFYLSETEIDSHPFIEREGRVYDMDMFTSIPDHAKAEHTELNDCDAFLFVGPYYGLVIKYGEKFDFIEGVDNEMIRVPDYENVMVGTFMILANEETIAA